MANYEGLVIEAVFNLNKKHLESLKNTGGGKRLMSWIEALSRQYIYKPLGFIELDNPTESEKTDQNFVYPGNPGSFMMWLISQNDKEIFVFMDEKAGFRHPIVKSAVSIEKSKAKDFITIDKKIPFEPGTTAFKIDIEATRIAEHYEDNE